MRYLIVFFSALLFASVGSIKEIKGKVEVLREKKIMKAFLNMEVETNDTVITYSNSKAKIIFKDNTIITIGQNSTFKIKEYLLGQQPKARFQFLRGTFISVTGKIGKIAPNRFKLETKNATIGIRGTIVFGKMYLTGDIIGCSEGLISVEKNGKSVLVKPGEIVGVFGNIITQPFKVSSSYLKYIIHNLSLTSKEIISFFGLIFEKLNSSSMKEKNNKSFKKIKENNISKEINFSKELNWSDYIINKPHKIQNKEFDNMIYDNDLFFKNFQYKVK